MTISSLNNWPEAFVSDTKMSGAVNRAVRAGRLCKLGLRLYTPNAGSSLYHGASSRSPARPRSPATLSLIRPAPRHREFDFKRR